MDLTEEILENLTEAKKNIDEEMKIALIGQPGAGKSSLINRIMGKKIFETGRHRATVRHVSPSMNGWRNSSRRTMTCIFSSLRASCMIRIRRCSSI